jgi:FkbM family methyltransferase
MSKVIQKLQAVTNPLLEPFGYCLTRLSVTPSFKRLCGLLEQYGLKPVTIIDVGVAYGSPWIYSAFPNAKYFLIDPTPQSLPFMRKWAERLNADVINLALGNTDGSVRIRIRPDHSGSSIFSEVGVVDISEEVVVPMRRFDTLVKQFDRPSLAKLDVQGAECLVLEGMGELVKELDCVIIETSLIPTLHESPDITDVIALMKSRGFVLYDVVGIVRRPLDEAMAQVDAVFVPENSPLRADRRWNRASTEERLPLRPLQPSRDNA